MGPVSVLLQAGFYDVEVLSECTCTVGAAKYDIALEGLGSSIPNVFLNIAWDIIPSHSKKPGMKNQGTSRQSGTDTC